MNFKNKKGFTLMELLVVITIIAVLAAVSIPQIIGVIQRAQDAAITADMRAIHMHAVKLHAVGVPPLLATGNFDTIRCTGGNADIMAMCTAIDGANGAPGVVSNVAAAPAQAFCISSPLHAGGHRCADHTGHWFTTAVTCSGTVFRCRP